MKGIRIIGLALALGAFSAAIGGFTAAADDKAKTAKEKEEAAKVEAEIKENLEKLTPEDRKLAEAQKFCAIDLENRLGEMGKPLKVTIKGQPVFLCCKGCQKEAEKNADATLEAVKELKKKNAPAPKDPK